MCPDRVVVNAATVEPGIEGQARRRASDDTRGARTRQPVRAAEQTERRPRACRRQQDERDARDSAPKGAVQLTEADRLTEAGER